MKQTKVVISLIMALMMIASTFVVVAGNVNITGGANPGLTVEKTVWDGESWVNEIYADLGDTVRFNIEITYYPVDPVSGYKAIDLVVNDTLPPCLDYANDAVITHGTDIYYGESLIDGKTIWWYLTADYGIELWDSDPDQPRTVYIEFNATVVSPGENVNHVKVTGTEKCSNEPLYGEDDATVIVEECCERSIEVVKKVWNGTGWDEHIDGLLIGDIVKFKIEITYIDECEPGYTLTNMVVVDYLPCCLDFYETIDINSTGEYMAYPHETVHGKVVYWNWTSYETLILHDGDIVTIEFETVFVNYCEGIGENLANVIAWGCDGPTYSFESEDNATVDCSAPPTTFDKYVKNGDEWAKEGFGVVGSEMTFKLEFKYYKEPDLTKARIKDELPCVLEFSELIESTINISVNVSEDNKIIWFNMSNDTITCGDVVIIEFTAIVTGVTGDCCPEAKNKAWLYISYCSQEEEPYYDEVDITTCENVPPCPPEIKDDSEGVVGEELTFTVKTVDYDGDDVYYFINWGNEEDGVWIGPYASGEEVEVTHVWEKQGEYTVKAKAMDTWDQESDWGSNITVNIVEEEPTEEGLSICVNVFNIGRVSATLKNIGEEDINDIVWNITVGRSGIIRNKVYAENNGTIDTLEGGNTTTVTSGKTGMLRLVLLGGYVRIAANSPDLDEPVEVTKKAYMIGPIVIVI